MKTILFSLLLINAVGVLAQDKQINITQEQIDKLAIEINVLTPSQLVPLFYAPAKVVVPGNHERLINSTQPGLVVQLNANIGDKIEKNQIIAHINSPDLLNLQRDFLTTSNELNLSNLEFSRDTKLLSEGVIADRRWQETQARHQSKLALFDANLQLLKIAGMSDNEIDTLAKTKKLSSLLNIHAPIGGIILNKLVTLGARLDIQTPLYHIADLSELWLEINVPQERLNTLHMGDRVRIENTEITAKISLLGQSVNRENQTIIARAIIDNKHEQLRVGQNINVQIMQNTEQPSFKVLNSAISQYDGHNYIFVRNAEGFKVTEVMIIGKENAEALITAPLTGNEYIAEKGAVALKANWLGLGSKE